MNKIQNYNTDRKCAEQFCSNDWQYYEEVEMNGMVVMIAMCEKHAEQWDMNILKLQKEKYGD